MAPRDLVVMGGSAGGVEALRTVVAGLPPRFAAAVLVVTHMPPAGESRLGHLLARAGPLRVVEVRAAIPIEESVIYVAVPNRHLVVTKGVVASEMGPRENRHRPSVDVLFRSAAAAFGPRVVGVVLSGGLDDGTAGLQAVKAAGGIAVVQDPDDAELPSMPLHALRGVEVDHSVPAHEIGPLLVRLTSTGGATKVRPPESQAASPTGPDDGHPPVPFACPERNGTLWEVREGRVARYRCRVGHSSSDESLVAENGANLERALWTALRILEERVAMLRRLADSARELGLDAVAAVHEEKLRATERDAAVLGDVIHGDLARHTGP